MTTTTATTNDGKGATQLERAPGGSARSGGLHAEAFSAFCGRFMEMGGRATRIEAEAAAARWDRRRVVAGSWSWNWGGF
eukprot:CAMPEP_0206577564 /NCGR_PEP_ID=MMETSP0325_2-20121206/31438_1 /ASSEMBLY_ACC=CAM_ASM_000347 /TAXON_ID=2866 /ORGANISM="Crypthecodinium cohnii, Strain Seligo" /LENGTH=78 /DNA_ID=CAMNT_0054083027 /DNA_START=478 /DNA_END=714 /DNA_ORIENTATION=+